MTMHHVSISVFEGPFNLLLELIEKEKLDISQVSLAEVTDQYLARLRKAEGLSANELADFLVVAAHLILIKSKQLLPEFEMTEEEEESIEDLERRLKEYRQFKEKSGVLRKRWRKKNTMWSRASFSNVEISFFPPPGASAALLREAIGQVVNELPRFEERREEAIARVVSLDERIEDLKQRMKNCAETSFKKAVGNRAKKSEVVVSFLALLELVKQRVVNVEQGSAFQDIIIKERKTNEPK